MMIGRKPYNSVQEGLVADSEVEEFLVDETTLV